jgi:serine/threonine-protein kinase HipA
VRLARELGLRTASVETGVFGGRKVLIVERYDRVVDERGMVERIHQEDMCQVMSLPPRQKYEEDGGPSLKRIATVLRESARPDSLRRLLQATTVNVLIGNGDAHGKNFSLFHHRDGSIELTPLYDLMSTLYYKDETLAMYIDGVQRTNKVTRQRLVNEAKAWGMRQDAISGTVDELVQRVPEAISRARDETAGLPPKIVAIVESQLRKLRN